MITSQILQIVYDAIEFQGSELGEEMKRNHTPPHYWKWVKLYSHRRSGYTTAAINLLEQYPDTLIITPTFQIAKHIRNFAIDRNLSHRCIPNVNVFSEHQLTEQWFKEQRWFYEQRSDRTQYRLIILDPASMVEQQRGLRMDEFRANLFLCCDLLVELS